MGVVGLRVARDKVETSAEEDGTLARGKVIEWMMEIFAKEEARYRWANSRPCFGCAR